ncbi:MAG TPA: tRNA epoxyqueuosine(34) reductase QueG, partial [Bacteroidia bacterium]
KTWAVKSGLGWMGKHGNILSKKKGSFFFLAEIICDLETIPDAPVQDHCGTCTKCIDACPTEAIESPYIVNGSKCISYATIELKDEIIPSEFKGKMDNWMFGCDICQQVCPWNRFSTPHTVKEFEPKEDLLNMNKSDWEEITQEVFQKLFKNSPVKRTKYEGLQRNIRFLME